MRVAALCLLLVLAGCADHYARVGSTLEEARAAERGCIMAAPAFQAPLGVLGGFIAAGEVKQCMRGQGYEE